LALTQKSSCSRRTPNQKLHAEKKEKEKKKSRELMGRGGELSKDHRGTANRGVLKEEKTPGRIKYGKEEPGGGGQSFSGGGNSKTRR